MEVYKLIFISLIEADNVLLPYVESAESIVFVSEIEPIVLVDMMHKNADLPLEEHRTFPTNIKHKFS